MMSKISIALFAAVVVCQVYASPEAQNWGPPPFGAPRGFGPPPPPPFFGGSGQSPNCNPLPPSPPSPPPGPPPVLDAGGCIPNPAANEALLRKVYSEVFSQKNVSNIDKYYALNHIEHNPFDRDGRDQVVELVTTGTLGGPPVNVEIQRMISAGDFVWVHSKFPITRLGSVFAIVDIFRFECGIIHEHWDVLQDTINLPGPVVSTHPFF
ncbi:cytokinesis protein sepA-like [Bradysia coprophila]|uniref:cytokinesis protein sepA-like n=1 Tax=Bradysia coprophila TaxID=38358 RepID=UPI00187DC05A|nr:cytokinesis protein sepA-like [Bradysia coprophila]